MIVAAVAVNALDLATFLLVMGAIPAQYHGVEVGPIAQAYAMGGPLGAAAFKTALLALVFGAAALNPRWGRWLVLAVILGPAVGAAFNIVAALQLGVL